MKNLLPALCILFCLNAKAQNVPNSDFETWIPGPWFSYPQDWITNNTQVMVPVTMDNDHYSGSYSMRVGANGIATCKFATSQVQQFNYFIKRTIVANDTVWVKIKALKNGSVVTQSAFEYNFPLAETSFSQGAIMVGIGQVATDSVEVQFIGGKQAGTSMLVDNVYINFPVSVETLGEQTHALYPNPMTTSATLKFANPAHETHTLRISDINGKLVKEIRDITAEEVMVDRGSLPAGTYSYALYNGSSKVLSGKLSVED
jgi:hypothetical protein